MEKFCPWCGAGLQSGSAFCPSCGKNLNDNCASEKVSVGEAERQLENGSENQGRLSLKSSTKKAIALIALAAVAIALFAFWLFTSSSFLLSKDDRVSDDVVYADVSSDAVAKDIVSTIPHAGNGWSVDDVILESQNSADDGTISVHATAELSTSGKASESSLSGEYEKDGNGNWQGSWNVMSSQVRATSGIVADPEGRWSKGTVSFNELEQTCTVSVPYQNALWFESASGDIVYRYAFEDGEWVFKGLDNTSSKVNYKNLVGTYEYSLSTTSKPLVTKFDITSVQDDGSIVANAVIQIVDSKVNETHSAQLAGTVTGAQAEDGTHRVVATLRGKTDQDYEVFLAFNTDKFTGQTSAKGDAKALDVVGYLVADVPKNGTQYHERYDFTGTVEVNNPRSAGISTSQ